MADFGVRLAVWAVDESKLRMLRHAVFVLEQGVPEEIERDDIDKDCSHVIAEDSSGTAIGCGRLIALATEGCYRRVMANAQEHACSFYQRHGFTAVGEPFSEAGIVHRAME